MACTLSMCRPSPLSTLTLCWLTRSFQLTKASKDSIDNNVTQTSALLGLESLQRGPRIQIQDSVSTKWTGTISLGWSRRCWMSGGECIFKRGSEKLILPVLPTLLLLLLFIRLLWNLTNSVCLFNCQEELTAPVENFPNYMKFAEQ